MSAERHRKAHGTCLRYATKDLQQLRIWIFIQDFFQVPTFFSVLTIDFMSQQPEIGLGIEAMLRTVQSQAAD